MHNFNLLRELRHKNGLKQQQVADRLHMDRSTYAYYESGHTRLNIDFLIAISRMYQVPLAAFLELPEPEAAPEPAEPATKGVPARFHWLEQEEQRLVILFRAGTAEQRRELLALAASMAEG